MIDKPTNPDLKDVQPGSDADETPVKSVGDTPSDPNQKPAPLENEEGEQRDDNIDDKGNKAGGGRMDQPT